MKINKQNLFVFRESAVLGRKKPQRSLTLLEPQSRFGDKPVKFSSSLSPKYNCGSEGVNHRIQKEDGTRQQKHHHLSMLSAVPVAKPPPTVDALLEGAPNIAF